MTVSRAIRRVAAQMPIVVTATMNSTVSAQEKGHQLTFIAGAATLGSVVRALNALGVSPRDLIAIVQALREAGSLQADVEMM